MLQGTVNAFPKGKECDVEWTLKYCGLKDICYRSPNFSFENVSWELLMRENGYKSSTSNEQYIGLHLFRDSKGPPIIVEFTFALKTMDGSKEFVRRNTGDFVYRDFYGFDDFQPNFQIERRKSEFMARGWITVVCTLKRLNSTGNIYATSPSYCKKTSNTRKRPSLQNKCGVNCTDLLQNCDEHKYKKSRTEVATNTQESYLDPPQDKFLKDFKQFFLKQELCDVVLRVDGREFQAHKAILGARSPVFLCNFRNDMKEKKTGIVDIEDCDPFIFSDFLCFLYSNDLDNLSAQNVFGLFTVADKYDIPDLRGKCLEFMKENLSVETFCETLTLALQYCEAELIHAATDFFIKNAKEILVSVKWQSFAAKNFTQSNELVIKFVESVKSPNT